MRTNTYALFDRIVVDFWTEEENLLLVNDIRDFMIAKVLKWKQPDWRIESRGYSGDRMAGCSRAVFADPDGAICGRGGKKTYIPRSTVCPRDRPTFGRPCPLRARAADRGA